MTEKEYNQLPYSEQFRIYKEWCKENDKNYLDLGDTLSEFLATLNKD